MHEKRVAILVAVLLCVLTALACGRSEPELSPLRDHAVVLAFGDSLTFGTGAGPEKSYPEVLQTLIGRTVVSSGVPGEITDEGVKRLPGVLAALHPDMVILCHGGNDLLRGLDKGRIAANLKRMIQLIRRQGAEVVLVAVPKPGLLMVISPVYGEVAGEMNVLVEETVLLEVLSRGEYRSDPIHPNDRGYAMMADAVAALLRRYGAFDPP